MIAQSLRINARTVATVFSKGSVAHSTAFILRFIHDGSAKKARFSVIVSKKQFGKAVERNYMRRKVYEALAQVLKHTSPLPGYYIFSPKKDVTNIDLEKLSEEIDFLLKKATI